MACASMNPWSDCTGSSRHARGPGCTSRASKTRGAARDITQAVWHTTAYLKLKARWHLVRIYFDGSYGSGATRGNRRYDCI
mmetsp:Transcript_41568/g.74562  ORF Transcript_41568/g.74562 Transcript_41568/m.74562 type:complete len:81 (+) Transcript_41568:68-310(+)